MNQVRRKRIIELAFNFLSVHTSEAEEFYASEADNIESDRVELEIDSKLMFAPSDEEYSLLQKLGNGGNFRTKQIITIALRYLQDNIEMVANEYPYYGNVERFAKTHITFGGLNFLCPTSQDIDEILAELDETVRLFPAMPMRSIGWRVYDYDDEIRDHICIDTVFFDSTCDRLYVRDALINHDGYSPSILIAP